MEHMLLGMSVPETVAKYVTYQNSKNFVRKLNYKDELYCTPRIEVSFLS